MKNPRMKHLSIRKAWFRKHYYLYEYTHVFSYGGTTQGINIWKNLLLTEHTSIFGFRKYLKTFNYARNITGEKRHHAWALEILNRGNVTAEDLKNLFGRMK